MCFIYRWDLPPTGSDAMPTMARLESGIWNHVKREPIGSIRGVAITQAHESAPLKPTLLYRLRADSPQSRPINGALSEHQIISISSCGHCGFLFPNNAFGCSPGTSPACPVCAEGDSVPVGVNNAAIFASRDWPLLKLSSENSESVATERGTSP